MVLVLSIALMFAACGGGGGGGGGGSAATTAALSTLCGPRYDLTVGKSCDGSLCKSGLVYGSAQDSAGPWDYGFTTSDAICTKACTTTSDCQGMSFVTANKAIVVAESWTCLTTSSGKFCAVSVDAPSGGHNSCYICGGAFCSGNCIGCPQCR